MLLLIGNEVVILKKDLVAVLDYNVHLASLTRNFLHAMRGEDRLVNLSEPGKERSVVLTTERVFISSISCHTLKKRVETGLFQEEQADNFTAGCGCLFQKKDQRNLVV